MDYFWKDSAGVNADLERHMQEERLLMDKLEKAETDGDEMRIRVYRSFLAKLWESKAKVVAKIGKKKE